MTEKEFMRQVWRPLDTVTVDGGIKGRVISVSFATKSVKVQVSKEVHEWFKYDLIDEHQSIKGLPDDDAIIEDLHNKLMAANKRNEDLQAIVNVQNEKLAKDPMDGLKNLRKAINEIGGSLAAKQKRMAQAESAIDRIHKWLDEKGVPQTEEEV